MWKDYCSRLKERSTGMGALKNDDVLYDYIARANPNIYFQPRAAKQMKVPQPVLFPGYLCPLATEEFEEEEPTPSQTQVIWSPLFDGTELKRLGGGLKSETALVPELPAGWRTAEQKLLEMGARNGDYLGNTVSSCSSNSEEEPPTVWTSAQCLLHMKDLTDPQSGIEQEQAPGIAESFLEYNSCELGGTDKLDHVPENLLLVDDYEEKLKSYHSEVSVEESRYQTCSGGDGSVCSVLSAGIGRGKLNSRESFREDVLLSEISGGEPSETRSCSTANDDSSSSVRGATTGRSKLLTPDGTKQVKHGDRKARRGYPYTSLKEEKVAKEFARPRIWNSGVNRGPLQQKTRKMVEQTPGRGAETTNKEQNAKNHNKTSTTSSTRRPPWCLHSVKRNLHHQHGTLSDHEVTSAGSTTNEEETRGAAMLADTGDQNAELISTLAEMNNRELRVLQCSAAIMRHNIGVLRDDVKGLQGFLEGRKARYSWWTLFKDFVVAAGLVSGAFGLRTVIDMLKRTVRYGALNKLTNKQEKMALAAFVLTVGARFGKQIWREQGNASSRREIKLREQLSRINERVSLMSDLATSDRQQTVAAAAAESE
ncbi:uncharacterized protein LOC112346254 [Selaginella moellendorffii]|uniref:uncharacterized protein LOC112346254 n=1 Tax=Selaginella moellendorffii TaxID=88036 RepID=UPI000D1C46B2|nr:uncharacterized protein LOC112346254 [Selaginella moellendorffii]|eukprot:XP_024530526.1 uncharacterized protein LOC112346254 [Selaginella moellendorffii]